METAAISLKHIKKIKDSGRFNIDNLQHYCLSVLIGPNDLQLCVTDTRKNRVLLLEDFILKGVHSTESHLQAIEQVYEDHTLLNAAFYKEIRVAFKNRKFSLVPQDLYEPSAKEDYLRINASLDPIADRVLDYQHQQSKMVTVHAAPALILDFLQKKYPNGNLQILHHSNGMLEGLMKYSDLPREKTLFFFIDRFQIHLAVVQQKKLHFFNTFSIRSSEDYIKYMLNVMQSLEMKPANNRVVLFGFIRPQSKHFQYLHKYARNISFGHRSKQLKANYEFDELGEHQYFDLLNLYHC